MVVTDKTQYGDQPFLLAKGITDYVVLPPTFVPELNKLPKDCLNSQMAHTDTLVGHHTGMDVVTKTSIHSRMLLSRVSPALGRLQKSASKQTAAMLADLLPKSTETWETIQPLDDIVLCVTCSMAESIFGLPLGHDLQLLQLVVDHVKNCERLACD